MNRRLLGRVVTTLGRAWAPRTFVADGSVWWVAAAVALGASHPRGVPLWAAALPVIVALVVRRPVLLVFAVALLASVLAERSHAGARPAERGRVDAVATLTSDPADRFGALTAEARVDGRRHEVTARGDAARALRGALAGERLHLTGPREPRRTDAEHQRVRHLVGRVVAESARPVDDGHLLAQAANRFRRVLAHGAEPLAPASRSLFLGFVLGDDREQDPGVIDDFRATGLTHLLAVSGANVAFVLTVLGPALRRLPLRGRFVLIGAALLGFATLTRFEPSVLRATAMASIAAAGMVLGRRIPSVRALGLAVAGLILIDPFLVDSFGFRLSVAASLGIIVLARPIAAHLPGPRPLADALAVTSAAQVAVAPLLIGTGDGVPVLALPANLLAAPVAGPVMVWGLTGGVVAGLGGAPVSTVLHLPTAILLGWVERVSRLLAGVPGGRLGWVHVAALGAIAAWAVRRRRRDATDRLRAPLLAAVVVLLVAAAMRPAAPDGVLGLGPGATLWASSGGSVLVVDGRADPGMVLAALRRSGHRRVAVAVGRSPSRATREVLAALVERLPPQVVLVPDGLAGGDRVVVDRPTELDIGDLTVTVRPEGDRLAVAVRRRNGGAVSARATRSARAPPHGRRHRTAGLTKRPV